MKVMLMKDGTKIYYNEIVADKPKFYHVSTNEYPQLAVEKAYIKDVDYKTRRVRL